jgi:hypothetical protein
MKNVRIISAAAAFVLLFAVSACEKEHKVGKNAPVVSINQPVDQKVYNSGDTLNVSITASDDVDLHEMEVRYVYTDSIGGNFSDTVRPYVHAKKPYEYTSSFILGNITVKRTLTISTDVYDHDDNLTSKSVTVSLNP